MMLGKVIRKYRKERNFTQEEMAERLGVTASAVNKWEREVTCPDIALLAPIARLLEISTDTLLSYRENLTPKEIKELMEKTQKMLKETSYGEAFEWAKKQMEQYPNCEDLVLNMAACFEAYAITHEVPEAEKKEKEICSLYQYLLESSEESVRMRAASGLVGYYRRKGEYEEAETYLQYFSIQNPERKRMQAQIYGETGRIKEAYKAYEELLFADYQRMSAILHGMYQLARKENDRERAGRLAEKQGELARCFEMGEFYEVVPQLDFAVLEQNRELALDTMEKVLDSVAGIGGFRQAWLYEHMTFQEMQPELLANMKKQLLQSFADEEIYGFLKEEPRWQALCGKQAENCGTSGKAEEK